MEPFRVRIGVRGYELDPQGHVNQAVYLQYAEHARWEVLRAAGITADTMLAAGVGPAALENTIRYRAELRAGDEIDVSCEFSWSTGRDAGPRPLDRGLRSATPAGGRTFRVTQNYHRLDGQLVAELTGVAGMLDLVRRKLVADPAEQLRSLASAPELLGL